MRRTRSSFIELIPAIGKGRNARERVIAEKKWGESWSIGFAVVVTNVTTVMITITLALVRAPRITGFHVTDRPDARFLPVASPRCQDSDLEFPSHASASVYSAGCLCASIEIIINVPGRRRDAAPSLPTESTRQWKLTGWGVYEISHHVGNVIN